MARSMFPEMVRPKSCRGGLLTRPYTTFTLFVAEMICLDHDKHQPQNRINNQIFVALIKRKTTILIELKPIQADP
jgi:hypothetical protein